MKKDFSPSELKTILHSKRANLYYLQHCRVLVNSGRVEYVTDEGKESLYWNIPIANTTTIMLGTGTSVTQAAMRELAKAGVLVGFCGGGGTPLFSGNEVQVDVSWLLPQSEYRPTEYLQQWVSFWFDDNARLTAAKAFQHQRIKQISKQWQRLENKYDFAYNAELLDSALQRFSDNIETCQTSQDLLLLEATTTKTLYKIACHAVQYGEFTRSERGNSTDIANRFLDHGNYLAYGLAATACWVLGLPHGLAVLHGKTRRGGLVFDVADVMKDAVVLPQAFISAMDGDDEQEFRQHCLEQFRKTQALDVMIETLQATAEQLARNKA
ncbi:type I-F CRISPR-associated endonuclease Cas1 [Photobacterium damselae subsp. damselae]|uniref:type I-F CRISPR-associated endonuclease Cas1f n=1 Tax=Photobacterium damselae TaxID=38293 RepID=UPI0010FF113A|nr:type I-F CRISPR-associated endonuclease Cas1f [Photobacterium damselae]NVH49381.1 type I-F CRISPR-associated endonuclease Cas1 [Photobacterium damselae subsp. damselae]NVO81311.1 type I-F CRISPR-associated endonuclease Cas1 [Photobacterium damselae subsp. damselae]TLS82050.1 type I-F CRISPR-associated endonuclease Cas1 [Photobacterium damselae subsp. damselae]TLS89267.1 type I-F CRISPR-associated endonuclease Cas1 [Photobacterium damselae subsp. damselae]